MIAELPLLPGLNDSDAFLDPYSSKVAQRYLWFLPSFSRPLRGTTPVRMIVALPGAVGFLYVISVIGMPRVPRRTKLENRYGRCSPYPPQTYMPKPHTAEASCIWISQIESLEWAIKISPGDGIIIPTALATTISRCLATRCPFQASQIFLFSPRAPSST